MARVGNVIQIGNKGNGFRMTVKGLGQTIKNLKLTANQRTQMQRFLLREATKIKNTAKATVAVDTGALQETHRVLTFGAEGKPVIRVDIVVGGMMAKGKFVYYAPIQHDRDPHLARALRLHAVGFSKRMAKAVKIHGKRVR